MRNPFKKLKEFFSRKKKDTTLELLEDVFEVPKEKRISEQIRKERLSGREIQRRLEIAKRKRKKITVRGKFKPKTAFEKRMWKKGVKPEENDN